MKEACTAYDSAWGLNIPYRKVLKVRSLFTWILINLLCSIRRRLECLHQRQTIIIDSRKDGSSIQGAKKQQRRDKNNKIKGAILNLTSSNVLHPKTVTEIAPKMSPETAQEEKNYVKPTVTLKPLKDRFDSIMNCLT